MNIQSNINQGISLASFLLSRSPAAENRKTGLEYQNRQVHAIEGLKDIEGNLNRFERSLSGELKKDDREYKEYGEEELKNIESRTRQYQKDIYDTKSAWLNPAYKRYINKDEIKQPDLTKKLTGIDKSLERVRQASSRANEAQVSSSIQQQRSKDFAKMITEGVMPEYPKREVIRYGE